LQSVDQIVVSVGPYRFQASAALSSNLSAKERDKFSPPQRIFNLWLPRQPVSSNIRHVTGVACITVAWELSIKSARRLPSKTVSASATTTVAPTVRGRKR